MAEPIERRAMFGWKPGMGKASAKANRTADGKFGVREIPRDTERNPWTRDKMTMFDTLTEARAYAYDKVTKWKGTPFPMMIYAFRKNIGMGRQIGLVYPTNVNKDHTVEPGRRWVVYESYGYQSKKGTWYLNRNGTLNEKR